MKKRLFSGLLIVIFFISFYSPCLAQTPGPIIVSKVNIDDDEDKWAQDQSEGEGAIPNNW